MQLTFELSDDASADLEIFDIAGRLVQAWRSHLDAGPHTVTWNFEARDGGRVNPGLHLVRLSARGARVTQRVVFLGDD